MIFGHVADRSGDSRHGDARNNDPVRIGQVGGAVGDVCGRGLLAFRRGERMRRRGDIPQFQHAHRRGVGNNDRVALIHTFIGQYGWTSRQPRSPNFSERILRDTGQDIDPPADATQKIPLRQTGQRRSVDPLLRGLCRGNQTMLQVGVGGKYRLNLGKAHVVNIAANVAMKIRLLHSGCSKRIFTLLL